MVDSRKGTLISAWNRGSIQFEQHTTVNRSTSDILTIRLITNIIYNISIFKLPDETERDEDDLEVEEHFNLGKDRLCQLQSMFDKSPASSTATQQISPGTLTIN